MVPPLRMPGVVEGLGRGLRSIGSDWPSLDGRGPNPYLARDLAQLAQ